MEIRQIGLESVEDLQKIAKETFFDTFQATTDPAAMAKFLEEDYALERLESELQDPESRVYFLYEEGEIAGYLKINTGSAQTEEMGMDSLEIQRIYIRPPFKRRGLGSRLLEWAIDIAKREGYRTVWLGVWEGNVAAKAFYQHYGFQKIGEHSFQVGQQVDTDEIMEKII